MPTTVPTQYQSIQQNNNHPQQQQQQPYQVGPGSNNAVVQPQGPPPAPATQPQPQLQMHQPHAAQAHLQGPQQHAQQQQQQFQRLKVEDALSYLDQVKLQFGNQPHVYNEFLDIMKEFKSQTIDTPGVINRVSNLFKGHSDLIVGFNTFLPPGYKIEVQANEQINVHQPGQAVMSLSTVMGLAAAAQTAANVDSTAPKASAPSATVSAANSQVNTQPTTSTGAAGPAYVNPRESNRPAVWDSFLKAALPVPPASSVVGGSHHSYHQSLPRSGPQQDTAIATTSPPQQHQQAANQPVEFNHAISYVNKIKTRFNGKPEIYKSFLEILHTYQKEQRNMKEGLGHGSQGGKPLSESEVYNQVANLFSNQEDLLAEFGQFLPDANGGGSGFFQGPLFASGSSHLSSGDSAALGGVRNDHSSTLKKPALQHKPMSAGSAAVRGGHIRRASGSGPLPNQPPAKKMKTSMKDLSLSEVAKTGSLADYAFFDKVRKALKYHEVYDNFLRCIQTFNRDVISSTELVQMVQPFLGKFPDLYRCFKDFLGYKDTGSIEAVPATAMGKERITGDFAKEIDFTTCKRYGASYRALPKNYELPKCSGRTQLCKEVLNDSWVSFPSWSEDSTFVSSKKTVFEEHIYRCEDERFEMDIVLETNAACIKSLEALNKKLGRLSHDEGSKYKLDNCLGGTSEVQNKKAVYRIYGNKAPDIIDGLKKNPLVAVPLVLRRLKSKDEEWREAQKKFNKSWRDQNEKYYLKSLDHQGLNFKQNDVKQIRSKALLNEIETIFDERQEAAQAAADEGSGNKDVAAGPHLTLYHRGDRSILDDAASLLVHHVKRQSSLHTDDKRKIKQLLHHFLPDLFHTPRGQLSDDECDDDENEDIKKEVDECNAASADKGETAITGESAAASTEEDKETPMDIDDHNQSTASETKDKSSPSPQKSDTIKTEEDIKKEPMEQDSTTSKEADNHLVNGMDTSNPEAVENSYSLFFVNNNWYLFLRLHQLLCERLYKMSQLAQDIAEEESLCKREKKESTAMALRLKAPREVEPEEYYPFLLDRIKDLLDGNMESSTYEDTLRDMFGIHAYTAFTLDKIVTNLVRQLQHLVGDEICLQSMDLFMQEKKKGGTGGPLSSAHQRNVAEQAYQRKAEHLMADENCFKVVLFAAEAKLTLELLDTEEQDNSDGVDAADQWSSYIEKYVNTEAPELSPIVRDALAQKPVFMARTIRQTRRVGSQPTGEGAYETSDSSNSPTKSPSPNDAASKQPMVNIDNTECKFSVNSFKLVHVVNGESCLYKMNALDRAQQSHRKVSLQKHKTWSLWHSHWAEENVSDEQEEECTKMLMGEISGLKNCSTRCYRNNSLNKAPYYTYNRFRVQYPEGDSEPPPASPDSASNDCA